MQRAQVLAQVVAAQRVVHGGAFGDRRVVEGGAVLGDVQRDVAVALLEPDQRVGQPLRVDLPARFGVGAVGLAHRHRAQRIRVRVVPDHRARVVVDADEIDALAGQREILCREIRPCGAEDLLELLRIAAQQRGVGELPVHVGVRARGGGHVFGAFGIRVFRLDVEHHADLVPAVRAIGLDAGAAGAHQVVRGDRRLVLVAVSGRQRAVQVAAVGDHPGFVERGPARHAVVQRLEHDLGVLGEPVCAVAVEPAAAVVQRRRQVPVEQRGVRRDAVLQQLVDQPRVEVQPLRIDPAGALGKHARPVDAEAVAIEAQRLHQLHVLTVTAVVVAGDVAGVAVGHHPGRMREALPDAGAGAVGQRRAFDLVSGSGGAPMETVGKNESGCGHGVP